MKFTLSWLKDHLDTEATLDAIVETLTRIGLEVEHVEDRAAALSAFTIASVVSAERHPNADKLQVCMVDIGQGPTVQVVCGAPNARAGMRSVFSPPGSFIPGKGITLGVGQIRGVESRGMLCSEAELNLSGDHDGIIDLAGDAPVGTSYATWAGLDDPVIEINLTPNRPDCTGVSGIARDLAAAGLGKLKTSVPAPVAGQGPAPEIRLDLGDQPQLCPAFALRRISGVRNGASPAWMQRRLTAIGLRPINALVDITNYITFDRGRPLHVFDAAKVRGALTVRMARDGETIEALNGRTYTLDPTMVVIADERGPESIAGIMGGEATGCDQDTTQVLIESALWDALATARTGRALGINTDARYRFERGMDSASAAPGAELGTGLVLDICGGTPSPLTLVGPGVPVQEAISFPVAEVERLTGLQVGPARSLSILRHLGFAVREDGLQTARVTPPSWRPDVEGKADLVEEVMRIVGLDQVPATPLPRPARVPAAVLTPLQRRTRLARRLLAGRGLQEAVTWSFIAHHQAERFGGGAPALTLANPIAADLSDMRPSLLPGLIASAQRNAARGRGEAALFEVGQVFAGDGPADQRIAAAGVRRATAHADRVGRHWSAPAVPVGVYDAKADLMALLAGLGAPVDRLQVVAGGPDWLHPGRSGTLQLGPQTVLGWFGELHPTLAAELDLTASFAVFEVILDRLPVPKARATRTKGALDLSAFQPVSRDFAFVVDRAVPAADLVKAASGVDRKLVTGVSVFDVYEGRGIEPGRKSVGIEITLEPRERTLTEAEIEGLSTRIIGEVARRTGAILRT